MEGKRLFIVGVILILLGVQFLVVESFELNEMATRAVEKRFPGGASSAAVTNYVSQDAYSDPFLSPAPTALSTTRHVAHPRQLAFAFISIGAILVFSSPAFKK